MGEIKRRSFLKGVVAAPAAVVSVAEPDLRAELRAKRKHYEERQDWYDRLENMDVDSAPEMNRLYREIVELEGRILRGYDGWDWRGG